MNRIIVTLAIIFVAITAFAKNNARADISFTNGEVLEDVEFKLPGGWVDYVEYFIDGKKHKIHADSIDHILLYHADYPERKAYLRRNPVGKYNFKKGELEDFKVKYWQVLESAGKYLEYWVSFRSVKIGKKGFTFTLGAFDGGRHTPYYFRKPSDPVALNIPSNLARIGVTREWLVNYLADDPEIVKRITDKGYFSRKRSDVLRNGNAANPFYYEDIAVDYNPQK